jgi:hypothetical protein
MDIKERAEYIATLSCRAMNIPNEGILIEKLPLKIKILLQADTLLPVIVCLANSLGDTFLDASKQYDSIFPFDLEKSEDSLCFVKLIENRKKSAPFSVQALLTMEIVNNIFEPTFDNTIDLTNLVNNWREVLTPKPNGQILDVSQIHTDLIMRNINYQNLLKNIPSSKLNKSK